MPSRGIPGTAWIAAGISSLAVFYVARAVSTDWVITCTLAISGGTVSWVSVLIAERLIWTTVARSVALMASALTVGVSGVVTLVNLSEPVGRIAGWSAVLAAAACAVMSLVLICSMREER